MSGGPAEPSNEQPLHGAWLQQERTRLALSRPILAERLGIPVLRITSVETRHQPVPSAWLVTLRELGFRLPGPARVEPPEYPVLSGEPAPSLLPLASAAGGAEPGADRRREAAHEVKQALTGTWLRSFCHEHSISLSQISERLDVPLDTVRYYEQHDRPLPSWWVKRIQPLAKQPPESKDLVEVITSYRLRLGHLAGQSPVEVLAWIAHDLRASGAEASVSFEDLEAAIAGLLSLRRARRD